MISFVSTIAGNVINTYDPAIVKEWLNSYPYLYKGFTPNKGQLATMDGKIAENVIFYSRNGNMGIFITENGLSYVIYDIEKKEVSKDKEILPHIEEKPENSVLHYARIDYELIGGKIKKENIIYQDELPGYENFYLAHCPDGILFVKSYRKVIIKDVYPGINWIFRYDDNGNFHHEFEIKNPQLISQIKLRVKYADIELADNGKSIILSTPIGKIKDGNLVGYQGNDIVEVIYRLKENNLLTFDISNYDKNKSLLIDPYALVWSTYYGGSYHDFGYSITTDANGNVFAIGSTFSTNFPIQDAGNNAYYQGTNAGNYDAFILKFTYSGVRLWATYYGGSLSDYAYSITTDDSGNVFLTGWTWSSNFPTHNPQNGAYYQGNLSGGGSHDVFILKFNDLGVRLWATYYGGTSGDIGYSISIDINGNVFLVGATSSSDFPIQSSSGAYYDSTCGGCPNYYDAFILKFSNSGALLWATYYGGSNEDRAFSIAIDDSGEIFVTGYTISTNFPTFDPQNGAYFDGTCGNVGNCGYDGYNYYSDAFILKFDNSGQRLWATYYGGNYIDGAFSIKTDINGNIFLTGWTNSSDFPTKDPQNGAYYQGSNAGSSDVFILKFSNSGVRLWATYYGGSRGDGSTDNPVSLTTDINGNLFIGGWTISSNFPVSNPMDGSFFDGDCGTDGNCNYDGSYYYSDAFILKFDSLGKRVWATYFGGSSYDFIRSIITDTQGNVFVVGYTLSTNIPTYSPSNNAYYQGANAGNYDAFISKFGDLLSKISEKKVYYYKSKISLNLNNFLTPITIKIYSLDGKLIYSNIFKTNNIEINLKSLKPGIYILKAYSKDNKQLTYKFIKN
ncbi:MAG: SBBP repeat-containing protein [candidate division WOR-3 bacterium]